ncbi:MAG TPA: VWA domain-containing protein [Candidatus Eisenbacteria bacterium]
MIFESPLWLLGLLALPLIAALEAWLTRLDRDRTARLVARPLWARVVRRRAERWRFVRLGLVLLGAAGIVLALGRPQWGIVREKVEREGVDVVLVLDTSGSMATEDVAPNRFFLARQALAALISRLEGDRFGLVAFEGEAYPLVPLTLDADALGLFLETMEPGIVPAPGTSLGVGLAKGLDLFVDQDRRNKVMVLVSDGEDLEGDVEAAVRRAKEAGVVVHTVGVGTEGGQPVPDFDREGRRTGFKHDPSGQAVISRLNLATLEAIARGTGGRAFRLTPVDPSLSGLAASIEGMEQKTLAREYSYRRKERFQIPLAVGLGSVALALLLPPPPLPRRVKRQARAKVAAPAAPPGASTASRSVAARASTVTGAVLAALLLGTAGTASAQSDSPPSPTSNSGTAGGPETRRGSGVLDELLLRPSRLTAEGRKQYAEGNHPQALSAFERAAHLRPQDPRGRFNLADGLYKSGRFDEAATLFRSLGEKGGSALAGPSRFNLGNALFQKQDYRGAVRAYREALRLSPNDLDTRRNLELALRALKEQEEQQNRQPQNQQNQKQNEKNQSQDSKQGQGSPRNQPAQRDSSKQAQGQPEPPKTPEQREDQRFRQEAGMPKERAMQLLDALQQNEKAEQKKRLLEQRVAKKGGRDW